jgi:molybdopterin converting factor small subunit
MEITLKLYASLSQYLPETSVKHATRIDISPSDNTFTLLDRLNVPNEEVHLVLLNGVYLHPEERKNLNFSDGDTLAIWPPVAGG